jgi:hypothetical protein
MQLHHHDHMNRQRPKDKNTTRSDGRVKSTSLGPCTHATIEQCISRGSCLFFRQPQAHGVLQKADLMTTNQRCRGCTTWRSHNSRDAVNTSNPFGSFPFAHANLHTLVSTQEIQTPTHTSLHLTAEPLLLSSPQDSKVWHGDDLPNTPRLNDTVQQFNQSIRVSEVELASGPLHSVGESANRPNPRSTNLHDTAEGQASALPT